MLLKKDLENVYLGLSLTKQVEVNGANKYMVELNSWLRETATSVLCSFIWLICSQEHGGDTVVSPLLQGLYLPAKWGHQ